MTTKRGQRDVSQVKVIAATASPAALARPLGWASLGVALGLLALLAAGGCSDDGAGPTAPDPVDPGPVAVSFATQIQPIFDANCIGCHGAGGSGGLDLRASATPGSLVGIAASGYAGTRVVPGDPHVSVLYQKVEGDPATGARMPFGGAALSPALRTLIHDWIEQGALDN